MKRKISLLILICLTKLISAKSIVADSLTFNGQVTHRDTEKPLVHAKLEIFSNDSTLLRTVLTNDSGEYSFRIPLYKNLVYNIKVSYSDFIYKIFQVNTEGVPSGTHEFMDIVANISLFEADSSVNYDLLDLPMSRFSYDPIKNTFQIDETYLEAMLASLDNFKRLEQKIKKEKEQHEIIIKQNAEKEISEKELAAEKTIRNIAIIGAIILFVLLFFIFNSLQKNIRQKKVILEKHSEIEEQKRVIEEKQKDIIDSITYARRIQRSLLPSEKYIDKNLTNLRDKKPSS